MQDRDMARILRSCDEDGDGDGDGKGGDGVGDSGDEDKGTLKYFLIGNFFFTFSPLGEPYRFKCICYYH